MSTSSKRKIRRIVVDGKLFVWNFRFRASSGTPGTVFGPDPLEAAEINLYTPAWAAALIRYSLTHGWQPENGRPPFVIKDGAGVLAALNYLST